MVIMGSILVGQNPSVPRKPVYTDAEAQQRKRRITGLSLVAAGVLLTLVMVLILVASWSRLRKQTEAWLEKVPLQPERRLENQPLIYPRAEGELGNMYPS